MLWIKAIHEYPGFSGNCLPGKSNQESNTTEDSESDNLGQTVLTTEDVNLLQNELSVGRTEDDLMADGDHSK